MKFTQDDRVTKVTLSERNLLALLAKLQQESSFCELQIRDQQGRLLSVKAERDEDHYGERIPGPLSDETQEILNRVKAAAV